MCYWHSLYIVQPPSAKVSISLPFHVVLAQSVYCPYFTVLEHFALLVFHYISHGAPCLNKRQKSTYCSSFGWSWIVAMISTPRLPVILLDNFFLTCTYTCTCAFLDEYGTTNLLVQIKKEICHQSEVLARLFLGL